MSDPNQEFQPPPPPTIEAPPERRRPANMLIIGIVLFVLGIGTGAAVACLGVLLFALSFVRLPEVGPHAPPPLGVFDRLAGIFYEPTRVFGNLRVYPRWVAGILVIAILNVAYIAAFTQRLTPERILNYTVDKMAESPLIPPEAVEKARTEGLEQARSPVFRAGNAVKGIVGAFSSWRFSRRFICSAVWHSAAA